MVGAFLYSLAAGMLGVVATGRPDQVAWKFLRLIGFMTLAIACGVTVWPMIASDAEGALGDACLLPLGIVLGLASVALVFVAPVAQRRPNLFRGTCALGAVAGVAAACAAQPFSADQYLSARYGIIVVSQVLGAALLGSITVAWLLGHAYLTATKMTIAPLRHFSRMLLWSVALRFAFVLVSLAAAWPIGGEEVVTNLRHAWLVLSLRIGVGLVAVGVFAYMVADCVKLRSTQSATGILYFGSLFAYIGELAHQYMIAHYGWAV